MDDCPSNSQIKFDFLASFSSLGLGKEYEETYWDANYTTFLLLKDPGARASLQTKLPAFMKKEMALFQPVNRKTIVDRIFVFISLFLSFADRYICSQFTGRILSCFYPYRFPTGKSIEGIF